MKMSPRLKAHAASRRRSGFSLVELLVAVVLLGILAGALTRLVMDQMRFFDNVTVARGARSAARNSMNVMLSELRMVQDSGGVTAIDPGNKSITVRVPYRFGVICGTTGGTTVVNMLPADSATLALATFAGFAWRNRTSGRYTIVSTTTNPPTSATPATCTGTGAGQAGMALVNVNGRTGGAYDLAASGIPSTMGPGQPVYFFQNITYTFAASTLYPGKWGLYRSVNGGTAEELMAPFASTARFRYFQTGDDTSRTTAPALSDIRGIAMVLTTEGSRKAAGRTTTNESRMMTAVFFKGTRAP